MRPGAFIILALFAVLLISKVAADEHAVKNTEEVNDVKSYGGGYGGGWGGPGGGGGGWGGHGGGWGGGGWGGGGGGWGGGCRWGRCCGGGGGSGGYYGGGCRCCYTAQEAIAYMQNEANP